MTWSDDNIIFLVSLPRAGSTLLQRILSSHSKIHSTAESWLLLPLFHSTRSGNVFSEFGHTHAATAINDFTSSLPDGKSTYYKEIQRMAVRLFEKATPKNKLYYLEKTPRNALIIDDLINTFPNSKFIFLWRNPLACASSMIDTFGKGKWNLFKYTVDLYDGIDCMIKATEKHHDRIIQINYENLLINPTNTINTLLQQLNLNETSSLIEQFQDVNFEGHMGDPTGIKKYSTLSAEPLNKWKQTLRTPTRILWAKRYIKWLGEDRLHTMGYDINELQKEINHIKPSTNYLASDLVRMSYGTLERTLQLKLFRHIIRTRHTREFNRRLF
ncbi:MAG: sulfotransferase [Methylococcales bacterium]